MRIIKNIVLFITGGIAYGFIEVLWRGKTHLSMLVLGGGCFAVLWDFYRRHKRMKLFCKCLCGSAIITALEFMCGCIVNLRLKMNVWDYYNCKLNVKGQICPLYSLLWGLLCIPVFGFCKALQRKND